MISIKDLEFSYGDHHVIKGLEIDLSEGEVHGILGVNGAGKSTFFKLLYGLENSDKGSIQWKGGNLSKKQSFLLETSNFFYPMITGREYLGLFPGASSIINQEDLESLFHLPLDDLIDSYSTGMKKKLAIMGMLKADREIFLMDEPFNGLDLESSRVLVLLMERLKKDGRTILVSSHILETLTNSCDQIHLLRDGVFAETFGKDKFEELEKDFFKEFDKSIRSRLNRDQ